MSNRYIYLGLTIYLLLFINNIYAQTAGMVTIKSTPSGADVYLQGNDTGRKTPFQKPLSPGAYTFTIKHEGFKDYSGEFDLQESEFEIIEAVLVPTGSILKVDTEPQGASVFIDGENHGKTPVTLQKIKPGTHEIQLVLEPYDEITETFKLIEGELTELNYELQSDLSILGILAYPDAEIYLDGRRVGNLSFSGNVEPGVHNIEVKKEGFITQQKEVFVEKGRDVTERFELQKITSNISVSSEPSGANIFFNGVKRGETPLEISDLEYGEYSVEITKDDYDPYHESIKIESDVPISINADLKWGEVVSIKSSPTEATVFIDGVEKGKTPLETTLKKGEYILKLSKFGYEDWLNTYVIRGKEQIDVDLEQKEFELSVKTNPEAAKVRINNRLIGKTPVNDKIPFGLSEITVSKKGYKEITEDFNMIERPLNLQYDLEYDKIRKKGTAIFYSLLFPGAGQSYLSRKSSPILFGILNLSAVGGYFYFDKEAQNAYQDYDNERVDMVRRRQLGEEMMELSDYRDYCLYGAAGLYAINLIWVAVMPDDSRRLKNVELSMNMNHFNHSPELGVNIKF